MSQHNPTTQELLALLKQRCWDFLQPCIDISEDGEFTKGAKNELAGVGNLVIKLAQYEDALAEKNNPTVEVIPFPALPSINNNNDTKPTYRIGGS